MLTVVSLRRNETALDTRCPDEKDLLGQVRRGLDGLRLVRVSGTPEPPRSPSYRRRLRDRWVLLPWKVASEKPLVSRTWATPLRFKQRPRPQRFLSRVRSRMPEPAAIVCTDDTTPMIVKYMMTSRLSESWPAGDANRRHPRAGGVAENVSELHRFVPA